MKDFRLLSALLVLSFAQQSYSQDKPLSAQNWVTTAKTFLHGVTFDLVQDKTNVPANVKGLLDAHQQEMQSISDDCNKKNTDPKEQHYGNSIFQRSWLPGYFIKWDVERYKNAQGLAIFIEKNRLKIKVANKWLYHIPGKPFELTNENYLVIAEKAAGEHPPCTRTWDRDHLSKSQLLQLKQIVNDVPFGDINPTNLTITSDGVVTIIDTDACTMTRKSGNPQVEPRKFIMPDFCIF